MDSGISDLMYVPFTKLMVFWATPYQRSPLCSADHGYSLVQDKKLVGRPLFCYNGGEHIVINMMTTASVMRIGASP
jgi:hypothetical protein